MSDITLPKEPRRRSRAQAIGEAGIPPKNVKKKRKARVMKRLHGVSLSVPVSDVIRKIEETYDVAQSQILRRFIEDGIKKYTPQFIEEAGLNKPENPFETLGPVSYSPPAYPYPYDDLSAIGYHPTNTIQSIHPPLEPLDTRDVLMPSGGKPLVRMDE